MAVGVTYLEGLEKLRQDGFLARDGVIHGLDQSHHGDVGIPGRHSKKKKKKRQIRTNI